MVKKLRLGTWLVALLGIGGALLFTSSQVSAITPLPTPDPKPGSFGIEATKTQPPPKEGAHITIPADGSSFTSSQITVSGICPDELLVQVYNNNVLAGSVMCESGSFSIQVTLFAGTNELSAVVYDTLEQAGPVSNTVQVTYTDTQFTAFGQLITLTSSYGRRSAAAGSQLMWPMQLSGGTGPYAFSIDWGDGSSAELKSQSLAGVVTLTRSYKRAGIYKVNVRVTDSNGVTAFLQVIAVASGKIDEALSKDATTGSTVKTVVLWIPALVALCLLIPSYWLGRRSQIVSLRKKMLKERDQYKGL